MQFLQFPPQSIAVSVPFWMLSEQLMQVLSVWSHVGIVPVLQSPSFVQLTQMPLASQIPLAHAVPSATGTNFGVPPMQVWSVQAFPSSAGKSSGSSLDAGLPSAPHTFFLQSFAVCIPAGSPAVSFGVHTEATHVETVQPSFVGGPQSMSSVHCVHPASVVQLPVLTLVLALVVLVVLVVLPLEAPPLPATSPERSSVQPPSATITAPKSARVILTPSAREPGADRRKKRCQEAMESPSSRRVGPSAPIVPDLRCRVEY